MKIILPLICMLVSGSAGASWFIECEVEGQVINLLETYESATNEYWAFDLKALSAKDTGSYTEEDCVQFSSGVHEIAVKKYQTESIAPMIGRVITLKYTYVEGRSRDSSQGVVGIRQWKIISYNQ